MDQEKRKRLLAKLLLARRSKPDHNKQARKKPIIRGKPKTMQKVSQHRTVKSTEFASESPADLGYVGGEEEEKVAVDDRFVRKPKDEDSIEDDEAKEFPDESGLLHVNMSRKHAQELWTKCVWKRSRDGKFVFDRNYGQIHCVMEDACYANAIYYLVNWMAAQKDDNLKVTCVTLHVHHKWMETKAVQSIVNPVLELCKDPTVKVNCIDTPYTKKDWKTIVFARSA